MRCRKVLFAGSVREWHLGARLQEHCGSGLFCQEGGPCFAGRGRVPRAASQEGTVSCVAPLGGAIPRTEYARGAVPCPENARGALLASLRQEGQLLHCHVSETPLGCQARLSS